MALLEGQLEIDPLGSSGILSLFTNRVKGSVKYC